MTGAKDEEETDVDREEKNCYEVVTKAVETHHVVAKNSFAAELKARSVVQHANPPADVAAVKAEATDREDCLLSPKPDQDD
jgi:hypothetical protein